VLTVIICQAKYSSVQKLKSMQSKSVQLTRAARFCLRFSMYLLIGII